MKKSILLTLAILFLISCQKEKELVDNELIGKWKLIEILMDPGDGSGVFQPVKSDKTVEFHTNGSITSNGSICFVSTQANSPSNGLYSSVDSTIISAACTNNLPLPIRFSKRNTTLIIIYNTCDEPCLEKYAKEE